MGSVRRLLAVVGAALIVVGLVATPAAAHNALTGSDPADGDTLDTAPERVRLTFLSSLDPDNSEVEVVGPDGEPVSDGAPDFDGRDVLIPIRAELAGEYRVTYEVLSTDGHVVEGAVTFTLTEEAVPEPSPSPSPTPAAAPTADPTPTQAPAADEELTPTAGEESGGATATIWTVAALLIIAGLVGLFIASRRKRGTTPPPV